MTPPAQRPEREEAAIREVGHTRITPALACCTGLLFCMTIFSVPLCQATFEWGLNRESPTRSPVPHALTIFPKISEILIRAITQPGSASEKLFAGNRNLINEMESYESKLEEDSFLTRHLLGPVQSFLTRAFQAGNEQVYPGKHRWLFYRPDVDYITEEGFDLGYKSPASVILRFHQELREQGIQLAVIPTPVKPTIHPEFFSLRFNSETPPLHNASYLSFLQNLEAEGVLVLDPSPLLTNQAGPQYLKTDTHWTFDAMEKVASRTALFLEESTGLSQGTVQFTRSEITVTNQGDIAALLKLPEGDPLYSSQVQILQQVLTSKNEFWKPDPAAEVLLLGDSFSNIYSLEGMGWGESAGFAEQLSYHLKQPIDAILQNDAGAHATRQKLSSELARGRNRLAGKKVVIWQFAARELTHGKWSSHPLDLGTPSQSAFYLPESSDPGFSTGIVASISSSPKPGTVPYKDSILTLHVVDLSVPGFEELQEGLVYAWGMRTNRLTQAARLRPGDRIKLQLSPWSDVEDSYSSYRRSLLRDINVELEEPCWAHQIIRTN